jgi:Family of unknown function (DUF6350)
VSLHFRRGPAPAGRPAADRRPDRDADRHAARRAALRRAVARRLPAVAAGLFGGVLAAGLGLGVLAVAVLLLWVTSPSADSSPGGALHIAAALWLLAHGGDLVRLRTTTGVPAPLGLTPLLLTALPVWLLNRVGAHAVEEPRRARAGGAHRAARDRHRLGTGATVVCLAAGYCLVAVAAVLYTSSGPLPSRPVTVLAAVPTVALLAAASGAWSVRGLPDPELPEPLARAVDRIMPWRATAVALRAAAAGTLVLVAGGALLAAVSLVRHAPLAAGSFAGLSQAPSGRFAVLVLSVALVPNAAVWGAAYALTPGFAVGVGTSVAPAGTWYPRPPNLPLLAALPGQGRGTLGWLALAVPALAALTVAAVVAREARGPMRGLWSVVDTAMVAALAAMAAGLAMAALAGLGSGPLGAHRLAQFGPPWRATGAAAFTWTAVVAIPASVVLRWRPRRKEAPAEPADRWWPASASASASAASGPETSGEAAPVGVASGVVPSVPVTSGRAKRVPTTPITSPPVKITPVKTTPTRNTPPKTTPPKTTPPKTTPPKTGPSKTAPAKPPAKAAPAKPKPLRIPQVKITVVPATPVTALPLPVVPVTPVSGTPAPQAPPRETVPSTSRARSLTITSGGLALALQAPLRTAPAPATTEARPAERPAPGRPAAPGSRETPGNRATPAGEPEKTPDAPRPDLSP